MSPPTIGILKVPATEAYLADPSVIDEALAILSQVPGTLGQWHGRGVQDPAYIYFVNAWESIGHRSAFAQDKDTYAKVGVAISPVFDSANPAWRYHVQFSGDPFKSLDGPVTEFAVWRLKEGTDGDQFARKLQELHDLVAERLGLDVSTGAWGASLEDPRVYLSCVGWASVEVFNGACEREEGIITLLGQMQETADLEAKHAGLSRYYSQRRCAA